MRYACRLLSTFSVGSGGAGVCGDGVLGGAAPIGVNLAKPQARQIRFLTAPYASI